MPISTQPAPQPTGIEAQVCNMIASRQQLGIAKYGQTVADNPISLRAWMQHALEECLDQAVYLKRAIAEIDQMTVMRVEWSSQVGVTLGVESGFLREPRPQIGDHVVVMPCPELKV